MESDHDDHVTGASSTKGLFMQLLGCLSLSLSLSWRGGCAHVLIMLLQNSSKIFFPEETGSVIACHSMSSSASDGIYSPLCSSVCDCSFPSLQLSAHFDDNFEDIKSTGSKRGDDPMVIEWSRKHQDPRSVSGALLNFYSMCNTNPSRHAEVMDHKSFRSEFQDLASCRFPSHEGCVCVYTLILS